MALGGNGFFSGGFAQGVNDSRTMALETRKLDMLDREARANEAAAIRTELTGNLDKLTGLLAQGAESFAGSREEYLQSDFVRQIMSYAAPIGQSLGMSQEMLAAGVPATLGDQRRAEALAGVAATEQTLGRTLTEPERAVLAGVATPEEKAPLIVQLLDAEAAAIASGDTERARSIRGQIDALGQSGGTQVNVSVPVSTGDANADAANETFANAMGTADSGRRTAILDLATTAPEATFTIQRLVDIISTPEFETGPGTSAVVDLQNLAGSLGVDLNQLSQGLFGKPADQLTNAQEFRRLANTLALDLVGRMKGSLSDRELAFVQQGVAGLGSTTEANVKALAAMLAAQEFIIDRAAEVRALDNTREAFLAFETDVSKRGADEMIARANEIEAMILERRSAASVVGNASAADKVDALMQVLQGEAQ